MNVGTGARTAAMPVFSAFSKEKIFPKFLLNLFLSKHLFITFCIHVTLVFKQSNGLMPIIVEL